MTRAIEAPPGPPGIIGRLRELDLAAGTVALWWLGQAGFAMRAGATVLLLDPFLSPMAERLYPPALDPEAAVGVDVVVCSHEHYDHLDLASLPAIARVSPGARFVVPRPLVDAVAGAGVPRARIVGAQPGEALRFDGVTLHPVPASHGVGMKDAYTFGMELSGGLYRYLGYVLDDGSMRVYHAGDTVAYPGMAERLRELRVEVALLPINGRDHYRESAGIVGNLDHREAAALAADAGADVLVPMHYDMFPGNQGYPAHLVDVVRREHPELSVIVPARGRPLLYATGRRPD
jgi:L-ascorbate metabolism protein UlaG (beta-lactamase superfamily)